MTRIAGVGLWLALVSFGCTSPQGTDAAVDGAVNDTRSDGATTDGSLDGTLLDATTRDGDDAVSPGDATDLGEVGDIVPGLDIVDARGADSQDAVVDDSSGLPDIPGVDIYDVIGTFDDRSLDDAPMGSTCNVEAGALPTVCTGDSDCLRAETCLPSGCGSTMRCQPRGRPCLGDTDCLATVQTCFHGVCQPSGTECGDSRACPLGYTCEGTPGATRCVNRRHVCNGSFDVCPYNSICYFQNGLAPFCVGLATHCTADATCVYGTCAEMDGDAVRECTIVGSCTGSTLCPATAGGNTCEILPVEARSYCGAHGYCSTSRPCPTGYDCLDVWGNGVLECRPATDPCHTHADCPAGQLCYTAVTEAVDPGTAGCR